MVEFKTEADKIIKDRWGFEVEHLCATRNGEKLTYEKLFYHIPEKMQDSPKSLENMEICGWQRYGRGCGATSMLKRAALRVPIYYQLMAQEAQIQSISSAQGAKPNIVQYLGIAADEPERIKRHKKPGFLMPLVEIGWDEAYCRKWCEENDLLSPIYTSITRGGCWFCHNQSVDQLRLLRKNYPDLWNLLLKWDLDSPRSFKANGHTVHDYDLRFTLEDEGRVMTDRRFRWKMIEKESGEDSADDVGNT